MKLMKLVRVLLKDIDLSSGNYDRCLFNSERDPGNMIDSIVKVGLINPVILQKSRDTDQAYIVVCGYQRILACLKLGWESVDARIIDGLNDEEALMIALYDNLSSRRFNGIEKAIIIKKLMGVGYSRNRILSEIAPLLEIPPNIKIIDKYLSVLNLDRDVVVSVANGELELEKAFLLIPLNDADKEIIFRNLFRESSTNINEAKEAIRNLLDLKLIKKQGMEDLLTSKEVIKILQDSKYNKRQKGERICKLIRCMRYPIISKKEGEFGMLCQGLGIDNDVRINHSRYFEGDEITITLKTSNEEKLKGNLEKLVSNLKSGSFKKIFSLFK